jgi:hypothetical protein
VVHARIKIGRYDVLAPNSGEHSSMASHLTVVFICGTCEVRGIIGLDFILPCIGITSSRRIAKDDKQKNAAMYPLCPADPRPFLRSIGPA